MKIIFVNSWYKPIVKLATSLVWVLKLQVIHSLQRFFSVLDNCTFYSKMYSVKLLALEWKDPKSNKRNVLLFFFLCRLELELGKIYYNSLKRIDLVAQGKECKHSKVSQCCRIFFYLSCIVYKCRTKRNGLRLLKRKYLLTLSFI